MSEAASLPRIVERHEGRMLYMQVADVLRGQIETGIWKPGTAIPSLDVLTRELGVARITLREAVRRLADEGLLAPARGRGTFVTERAGGHRIHRLETSFPKMLAALSEDNIEIDAIDPARAGFDGVDPPDGVDPQDFHAVYRVHSRQGLRYCVNAIRIANDLYDRAPQRFETELALAVVDDLLGSEIREVRQRVRFGTCSAYVARQLGYLAGEPVATINRTIHLTDGRLVYYADVTYRADVIEIDMSLDLER